MLASTSAGVASRPLFVVVNGDVAPSLRMVWLGEGLNDAAMVGLLEQRADPSLVQELFAGIIGRTGIASALAGDAGSDNGSIAGVLSPGYLYAGWPEEKSTWASMPAMLEKMVLANDPGAAGKGGADDPLYMATKLWLAARRPVARVGGYQFDLRSGRDGDVLDWTIHVLAENPINTPVEMEAKFPLLPGDLELTGEGTRGRRIVDVPGYRLADMVLPLTGHLDSLEMPLPPSALELSERHGGAFLQLPVALPICRMSPTTAPLRIDGQAADWPAESQGKITGAMTAGFHYLSRPDLLRGNLRPDDSPAIARWTYDADYLYVLVRCPQSSVTDERNNDWPIQEQRWWGTDGVQIQLADGRGGRTIKRVVQLGFKPGGVMMTRVAELRAGKETNWSDGAPAEGGGGGVVRYGTSVEKADGRVAGYLVEAAIPRKWFESAAAGDQNVPPAWRVNVLRHRASDLASMSWSGPLVNDEDFGMMGLLVGKP